MQKQTPLSMSVAAGMSFSRECRFFFWTGWVSWTLASLGLVFGEFALRVSDPLHGYLLEALGMMVGWFLALALADSTAIRLYRETWRRLKQETIAPIVLEQQVVDRIRAELATDPLLRWLRPPKSSDVRGQLMTASLWWQALVAPEGSPRWQRYGEWLTDALFGYPPLVLATVVLMTWPTWKGSGVAALLAATGLSVLGYSLIRLAARRQAIVDYFNTWRCGDDASD